MLSSSILFRRNILRGCALLEVSASILFRRDILRGCASSVACPAVEKTCPPFQAAKSFEGWWSLRRFAKIVLLCAMNLRLDRVSGIAPFCGCLNLNRLRDYGLSATDASLRAFSKPRPASPEGASQFAFTPPFTPPWSMANEFGLLFSTRFNYHYLPLGHPHL